MGAMVEAAIPFPSVELEKRVPPDRDEVEVILRGAATAVATKNQ